MIIGWIIIKICVIGILYNLYELYNEKRRYFYMVIDINNNTGGIVMPYILIYDYKKSYILNSPYFPEHKGKLNKKYVINNNILKNMLNTGRWESNKDIFEILLKEYING